MIGIYKITNKINNKSYIGQSVNISKRWYEHLNKRGNPNLPLYKDFDKYGSDNFTFTILEHCKKEELNEKEIYYIKFYNSLIPNGYNLQKGGRSKGYEIYFLFSKEDIDNIYSLLRENKLTFNEIAEKYNVSNTLIRYINEGIEYPQDDIQYPIRSREDSHKIHYTNLKNKLCGEQSYRATITEETAKKIIFDLENNLELKIVDIAKKYNTTIDVVKDINRFKSWKHIERKKPCREDLGNNVLLPDEVKDIKILLKNPKIKYSDIMKKYPLATYYIINKINKGETWKEDNIDYPIRKYISKPGKLTYEEVEEICQLLQNTKETYKDIGLRYNISGQSVSEINNHKSYKYLTEQYNNPIRSK